MQDCLCTLQYLEAVRVYHSKSQANGRCARAYADTQTVKNHQTKEMSACRLNDCTTSCTKQWVIKHTVHKRANSDTGMTLISWTVML